MPMTLYELYCNCSYFNFAGLDLKNIEKCMGDPNADSDNPVLKEEQDAQVSISYSYTVVVHMKCQLVIPF